RLVLVVGEQRTRDRQPAAPMLSPQLARRLHEGRDQRGAVDAAAGSADDEWTLARVHRRALGRQVSAVDDAGSLGRDQPVSRFVVDHLARAVHADAHVALAYHLVKAGALPE